MGVREREREKWGPMGSPLTTVPIHTHFHVLKIKFCCTESARRMDFKNKMVFFFCSSTGMRVISHYDGDTPNPHPSPCIELNSVHESGRRMSVAPKFIYFFF